jgi:hypothetical protein
LQDSDLPIGHDGQSSLVAWRDWGDLNTGNNFNYHFLIALHNFRVKKRNILTLKEENGLNIANVTEVEGAPVTILVPE